jgi:hypothetical protein
VCGKPSLPPFFLGKSRMRKRARTDLCGGRSAMVVPTATVILAQACFGVALGITSGLPVTRDLGDASIGSPNNLPCTEIVPSTQNVNLNGALDGTRNGN